MPLSDFLSLSCYLSFYVLKMITQRIQTYRENRVFLVFLHTYSLKSIVWILVPTFRIGRTIVLWYFDFSRIRHFGIWDTSSEGCLPSPLEHSVYLWVSAGSVMDLGFHGPYFRCSFCYVVAKIAYVWFLVSRFPSLSVFAASNLGLLFGKLLLFDPVEVFLFFRHRFIERRVFPSWSASGSPCMYISVLFVSLET